MVYLKSVENVITLGKLIGLLFLFCLPLLSILFLITKRNDFARPVMGTIFLVGERSEPLSRVFNDPTCGIYIYIIMVESVRTYVSNTQAHVRMSVYY